MFRKTSRVLLVASIFALWTGCKPNPKADPAAQARHKIDSAERVLLAGLEASAKTATPPAQTDQELTQVLALAQQYQYFRADFPDDTAAPRYMLKEAEIFYNYLRDPEMAGKLFGDLASKYPKARQRPAALFFLANTQHDLGDTTAAQATLQSLMADYPGSAPAAMAKQLSAYIRLGQIPAGHTTP